MQGSTKVSSFATRIALGEFLAAYHNRGETRTGELLAFVGLLPDGGSADPAQLQDFVSAFERVNAKDEG